MTVGEMIRLIRNEKGITQKQLADRIGIDDATIRKYESGKLHPKPVTIEKIAAGLGVHADALTENEQNPEKAMHTLFHLFKLFDGEIIKADDTDSVYITFNALAKELKDWYSRYEEYLFYMNEARIQENDTYRMMREMSAQLGFDSWMESYPNDCNPHDPKGIAHKVYIENLRNNRQNKTK